ncbi:MAG: hypothetical protein LBD17_02205 [Endomicrobium sp.]|nr:hypothetical protein [Endomicrobium sp.]
MDYTVKPFIVSYIDRLGKNNFSNVKSVGYGNTCLKNLAAISQELGLVLHLDTASNFIFR